MNEEQMDMGLPEGLKVSLEGNELVITRKWFTWIIIFLTFFCVAWDSFLVFWYSMAINIQSNGVEIFFILFPIVHVAVGAGLTYYVIASYVNTTIIRVSYERLMVKHGPVPWPGNKTIPCNSIAQLFCKEIISRNKNGVSVTYTVSAILKNNTNIKLVSGLNLHEQALYIEQEIEKYLGIKDRPVKGEAK